MSPGNLFKKPSDLALAFSPLKHRPLYGISKNASHGKCRFASNSPLSPKCEFPPNLSPLFWPPKIVSPGGPVTVRPRGAFFCPFFITSPFFRVIASCKVCARPNNKAAPVEPLYYWRPARYIRLDIRIICLSARPGQTTTPRRDLNGTATCGPHVSLSTPHRRGRAVLTAKMVAIGRFSS